MQDAHTLYMDLNNIFFVQIKFNFFRSRYIMYIHFQCQWAIPWRLN